MNEWWAVLKNNADDWTEEEERWQAEEAKRVQDRENGISEYGGPLCDDCKENTGGYCSGGCYELSGEMPQSEHWKYAGVEPQWTQDWDAMGQEWKDAARKQWPSEEESAPRGTLFGQEVSQGDFDEENMGNDISVEDLYGNPVIIPSLGRPITEEEESEYSGWQKHGHHTEWAEGQRREQEAAQAAVQSKRDTWDALIAEAEELGIPSDDWYITESSPDNLDGLQRRVDDVKRTQGTRRGRTNRRRRNFRRGEPMDMAWRLLKHA
tara:strand:- start:683 stop:1477 length:795 start_codon:yes stop_codon:yes gene_type:complete